MTGAYVTVRDYGSDTHTICDTCHLDERHPRHKPAAASAHRHNQQHHDRSTTT